MLLSKVIKRINKLVGNSSSYALTYDQLEQYFSAAVHTINLKLKTNMPTPEKDWALHRTYYSIIYSKQFLGSFNYIDTTINLKLGDMYYNLLDEDYYIYTQSGWSKIFANESDTGAIVKQITIGTSTYDYQCMPDEIIESVLIYLVAAFYLEEEDELESQYRQYISRAEENLTNIQHIYYSSYDMCTVDSKHIVPLGPKNPYWIGDDE